MKKPDNKKTKIIICIIILAAIMLLLGYQMTKMGKTESLFFDGYGLPTLWFDAAGVLFGGVLIYLSKLIDEKNTSLKKLCKIIGILEIASAVLYFIMVQILLSAIN